MPSMTMLPAQSEVIQHRNMLADRLITTSPRKGGFAHLFEDTRDIDALLRIPGSTINKRDTMRNAALAMDNMRRYYESICETTSSAGLSGFLDHIFPMIRFSVPNNPINDLVSVQAMNRKVGQVFTMKLVYGDAKGRITKGQASMDPYTGYAGFQEYAGEQVVQELLGAGGSTAYTKTLAYAPLSSQDVGGIRPGTVKVTWTGNDGVTPGSAVDNGNSGLVVQTGNETLSVGAINYGSGYIAITFSAAPPAASSVYVSYEYDSEGMANAPTVDVQIISTPVTARRQMLRTKLTLDAIMDLKAELGEDAEAITNSGVTSQLIAEQARIVVNDIWALAGPAAGSFSINFAANTNQNKREQASDLVNPLSNVMNQMLKETQRFKPNWMIVDTAFLTLLNTLGAPYFAGWQEAPHANDLGVQFVGTWNGTVRVYCDPLLDTNPGASPFGNCLMGYKGNNFYETGYIWAPYLPLYSSPGITLDDMVTRKAYASRNGRKGVNARLYKRFVLTG